MKSYLPKLFSFSILFYLISCNAQNQSASKKSDNNTPPSASKLLHAKVDSSQVMADVKYLASDELEGRGTGTKGADLAAQFIAKRFSSLGLEKITNDFYQPFSIKLKSGETECKNVLAKIKGSKHPEKYVVLTAHYDHLGYHDGKIFNGADDNASGVAAIMAAAKYFKKNPPKHSIIFVALDAEEVGLQGAKYFVKNSPVSLDNILMNINLDMISRNAKNEIYICGTHHYPILKESLTNIDQNSKLNVKFGHDTPDLGFNDWTNSSDHAPFHKEKIPFIYLGVEDHEDYHKHTDTFEKIQYSFLFHATNLLIDLVLAFD